MYDKTQLFGPVKNKRTRILKAKTTHRKKIDHPIGYISDVIFLVLGIVPKRNLLFLIFFV